MPKKSSYDIDVEIKEINDMAVRLNNKIDALNRYYSEQLRK